MQTPAGGENKVCVQLVDRSPNMKVSGEAVEQEFSHT
jgi:hypothetical protein